MVVAHSPRDGARARAIVAALGLFVLDPRARGVLGLALFRDAAARLGWIVMSSHNTLSDGPVEPNVAAMNAMLAWAQARLAVDSARVYLAGFSGTARGRGMRAAAGGAGRGDPGAAGAAVGPVPLLNACIPRPR